MAKKSSEKSKPKEKPSSQVPAEHWTDEPAEHDYPAAADYLSLICSKTEVTRLVAALKVAPIERRKAKDLLRASTLTLLPTDNAHVRSDLAKVEHGTALSPVLLVRGDIRSATPLTIADGYHRVCASYHLDENADIPCHVVDLTPPRVRTARRGPSTRGPAGVQ